MVTSFTQKDEFSQIRDCIKRFEIRDPIKTLFKPEFSIAYDFGRDTANIQLRATSPDADGKKPFVQVNINDSVPNTWLHPCVYTVLGLQELVNNKLRDLLYKMLKHEADESIWCNEQKIFDPHKGE